MSPFISVMLRGRSIPLLCALAACGTASAATQAAPMAGVGTPAQRAPSSTNYAVDSHWLCRPGRDDICSQPLTVTDPVSGGAKTLRRNPEAPVDCFYAYPPVSYDKPANSDLDAGPEERRAAQYQLAPFGRVCRLFAPVYRQVTAAALNSRSNVTPMQSDAAIAYGDVLDAWNDYLARDNRGRGVVLIGHSQGSRVLAELIAREIEGKPVQGRILSAMLIGINIAVPKGRDVGGAFKSMPLCRSARQTGCVIAYNAFRAESPPPADALYSRIHETSIGGTDPTAFSVACTNPAALAGGPGTLHGLVPIRQNLPGQPTTSGAWGVRTREFATTFLGLPELAAECVDVDGASYLSVNLPPDVPGDVVTNGKVVSTWGLHNLDISLAVGNLLQIVHQQARAYGQTR